MARIKDTCLTGQHFSPLWNLDLRVYIQELDVERRLMCGRKGLQGGENRRPWKDRRTLHAFFHVEPDLPRVYVEKERARGQWGEREQNAMRCLKTSVMAWTLHSNEFKSHTCPRVSLSSAQDENADSPARCSQGRLSWALVRNSEVVSTFYLTRNGAVTLFPWLVIVKSPSILWRCRHSTFGSRLCNSTARWCKTGHLVAPKWKVDESLGPTDLLKSAVSITWKSPLGLLPVALEWWWTNVHQAELLSTL